MKVALGIARRPALAGITIAFIVSGIAAWMFWPRRHDAEARSRSQALLGDLFADLRANGYRPNPMLAAHLAPGTILQTAV